VFRNLFFENGFRDHNYNDFFDDMDGFGGLETVPHEYLENSLRDSFKPGWKFGPEPYFSRTLPTTLSPKACESYLRHSRLPIDRRDYYLSKLFQFFYIVLDAKFEIGFSDRKVSLQLREILEGIPVDLLPPDSRIAWSELWWDFYGHTCSEGLDAVMSWLEKEIGARIEAHHGEAAGQTRKRRRGPQPQLSLCRKTARIVQSLGPSDWSRSEKIKSVCETLDREEVPMSPAWERWKSPPKTWIDALVGRKELVTKLIDYRLKQDRAYPGG